MKYSKETTIPIPFRCIVSRSLSLSESAFALDDAMRIFRRDTVGELSLEFVSGALLSILVKPTTNNEIHSSSIESVTLPLDIRLEVVFKFKHRNFASQAF